MKKKILIGTVVLIVIFNLISNILTLLDRDTNLKVAFVRSHDLIYSYEGMKEMQTKLTVKQHQWQTNIDTLKQQYNNALSQFNKQKENLSSEQIEIKTQALIEKQQQIMQYSQEVEALSQAEEDKMTQSVLNQINAFAQKYGKENGYSVIFGTTMTGSILYGQDVLDITDELLNELNINYLGE